MIQIQSKLLRQQDQFLLGKQVRAIYNFHRIKAHQLQTKIQMSTRLTINIGFYFEKQHYAQLHGFVPRSQAIKIPELRVMDRQNNPIRQLNENKIQKPFKNQAQDQLSQEENQNIPMDLQKQNDDQIDNEMQNQDENEIDQQQQNQVDRALQQLQQEHYDSDQLSQDEEDDQIDISSVQGQTPLKGFNNTKTKRQKGENSNLIQLPDRRARKDKKIDQAQQMIRREEKQKKRKQYLKKQTEAQQKATLQKILNQTGRKLRMREQKQIQDQIERQQKVYKSLGNVPKIITLITDEGKIIMTHKTTLFPQQMTCTHDIKMKEICTNCGNQSKYKLKNEYKFACSLPCYKIVSVKS